jgi:hypothetical protein
MRIHRSIRRRFRRRRNTAGLEQFVHQLDPSSSRGRPTDMRNTGKGGPGLRRAVGGTVSRPPTICENAAGRPAYMLNTGKGRPRLRAAAAQCTVRQNMPAFLLLASRYNTPGALTLACPYGNGAPFAENSRTVASCSSRFDALVQVEHTESCLTCVRTGCAAAVDAVGRYGLRKVRGKQRVLSGGDVNL